MSKKTESGVVAREGYEAYTGLRALERAGHCKNLHGHVHEVMFCDKFNVNPENIIQSKHAALSPSATDTLHDVLVTKDGNIVGGFQLKDTASPGGIRKTIEQVNSGKYSHTTMVGTSETASQIAGKTTQQVKSSGISSETTHRIANKALGQMPSMSALGAATRSGGVAGAAFGAGIEAVSSFVDVCNGKKKVEDAVVDVGAAAVKGGVTGAGSAAAGAVASGATGAAITAAASTGVGSAVIAAAPAAVVAAAPLAVGFGVACVVGSFISSFFDD